MKQINVIKENCIGCGACVAIDPDHFDFDDEGKSNVISNEDLEDQKLIMAIESCPTSAIEIIESEENNQDNDDVEDNNSENLVIPKVQTDNKEECLCDHNCEHHCNHCNHEEEI